MSSKFNFLKLITSLFRDILQLLEYVEPHRPLQPFLGDLPAELILVIDNFLPLSSKTCLSLCSRCHYSLLGSNYPSLVNSDPSQLRQFLVLLETELPEHILCHVCVKFHRIQKARNYVCAKRKRYWTDGLSAPCNHWRRLADQISLPRGIRYPIIQMAMKRHRQDRDPSDLLGSLREYEDLLVIPYKDRAFARYTHMPRIVDGSLLMMEQQIFITRLSFLQGRPFFSWPRACIHNGYLIDLEFPQALGGNVPKWTPNKDMWRWPGELNVPGQQGQEELESIESCRYCRTEYRIDFKEFGECGAAVFFTRWIDLGEGLSADDPVWTALLTGWTELEGIEKRRDGVARRFQRGEEFRFDEMLSRKDLRKAIKEFSASRPGNWEYYH